jgi:hypothetical protein
MLLGNKLSAGNKTLGNKFNTNLTFLGNKINSQYGRKKLILPTMNTQTRTSPIEKYNRNDQ